MARVISLSLSQRPLSLLFPPRMRRRRGGYLAAMNLTKLTVTIRIQSDHLFGSISPTPPRSLSLPAAIRFDPSAFLFAAMIYCCSSWCASRWHCLPCHLCYCSHPALSPRSPSTCNLTPPTPIIPTGLLSGLASESALPQITNAISHCRPSILFCRCDDHNRPGVGPFSTYRSSQPLNLFPTLLNFWEQIFRQDFGGKCSGDGSRDSGDQSKHTARDQDETSRRSGEKASHLLWAGLKTAVAALLHITSDRMFSVPQSPMLSQFRFTHLHWHWHRGKGGLECIGGVRVCLDRNGPISGQVGGKRGVCGGPCLGQRMRQICGSR